MQLAFWSMWVMAIIVGLPSLKPVEGSAVTTTAYVAFLCNEAMLLPILVLIRSLKVDQAHTNSDICIMVTDGVPKKGRQAIEAEGAKLLEAPETPYPYEVTEKRKKMAKFCRYVKSKFLLFGPSCSSCTRLQFCNVCQTTYIAELKQ